MWIMGRADRVESKLLELPHVLEMQRVGNGVADVGVMLVPIGADHLQRLSVQEETIVLAQLDRTDTEGVFDAVRGTIAVIDQCVDAIEIGIIAGPQMQVLFDPSTLIECVVRSRQDSRPILET